MAVRKFIVVGPGQSNDLPFGDAQSWEELHLPIALRSPLTQLAEAALYSEGAYHEAFTMPAPFSGGPQSARFGDGERGGSWQTVDCKGRAIQQVRFLTFYNPQAAYLQENSALESGDKFPGSGTILAGSTSISLATTVRWQYDPVGIVITRKRTGKTHTIAAGWAAPTNVVTISPPMIPPPEPREQFTYALKAGENSANASEVRLCSQFGGAADAGSILDPEAFLAANIFALLNNGGHVCEMRATLTATGFGPAMVVCKTRPAYVGQPIAFTTSTLELALVTGMDAGANTIALVNDFLDNGDPVGFFDAGGGTLPAAFNFVDVFWIVNKVDLGATSTVQLAATPGGAPIDFGAGFGGLVILRSVVPHASLVTNIGYVTRLGVEMEQKTVAFQGGPNVIQLVSPAAGAHGLVHNEAVVAAGAGLPPQITAGVTYYIRMTGMAFGDAQLSATPGGPAIDFDNGSSDCTLTRLDGYAHFFVSLTPGGAEISVIGDRGADLFVSFLAVTRGSLTGLQITCTGSGGAPSLGNVGLSRPLADCEGHGGGGQVRLKLGTAFPGTPQSGDTFTIEVPPRNGVAIPFERWAFWLPWSPFEGSAHATRIEQVGVVSPAAPAPVTVSTGKPVAIGDVMRFVPVNATPGALPTPLLAGARYYVTSVFGPTCTISASYNGPTLIGDNGGASGLVGMVVLRQEARSNPFPPGFNYPNHDPIPRRTQPFDGPELNGLPKQGFAAGLAVALSEHIGEPVYVLMAAVAATAAGHQELVDPGVSPNGFGWFDPKQQLSWAPGEPNNCFARFVDTLVAAKLAAEAQGDTLECIGFFPFQGEKDANDEALSERYLENWSAIKVAARKAVKDAGLCSGSAERIPWVDAQIVTGLWPFAETINDAKKEMVKSDPWSRIFPTFALSAELIGNGMMPDLIHLDGTGHTTVEGLALAAWKSMQSAGATELDICKLALAHIGHGADVQALTSIDPPDGSAAALACATFFGQVRDELLEQHEWTFATRRAPLVPIEQPDDVNLRERPEYTFAYERPRDCAGLTRLMGPGNYDDARSEKFVEERAVNGTQVIYTQIEGAIAVYNAKVFDPTRWTAQFRGCVALKLGAALAGVLQQGDAGTQKRLLLERELAFKLPKAKARDAAQSKTKPRDQRARWDRRGCYPLGTDPFPPVPPA